MQRSEIGKKFISLCLGLEKETSAISSSVSSSRARDSVKLKFGTFELELCFMKAASSNTPPCTLYCLYLPYSAKGRYLHLGEVVNSFDCSVFPYIENTERLEKCFSGLAGVIKNNLVALADISCERDEVKRLMDAQEQELRRIFKLKEKHFPPDEEDKTEYLIYVEDLYTYTYYLPAFTIDDAYISYLKGEFAKAEKRYSRKKKRIFAEEKLVAALDAMETGYSPMPDGCFAAKDLARARRGSYILSFLLIFGILTCLFSMSIHAIYALISYGTVYTYKLPWYFAVLPAAIPAFFAAFIHNDGIIRFVRRDWGRRLTEFNDISFGPILRVFTNIVIVCTLAMSLMVTIWATSDTVKFYDDRMTVPAVEYPTPWTEVTELKYENVHSVYAIDGRVNKFGEVIDRASYVIVFNNGYMLDLDGYLPYSQQKSHALEIAGRLGIQPINVATDADIPKITEKSPE